MTLLRLLSTIGLSVLLGMLIWLAMSGLQYFVMDNWTGQPPLSPGEPSDHIKGGLAVGIVNGTLVAVGLVLTMHRNSVGEGVVAGVVVTEIALAIFQAWYFTFVFFNWKGQTAIETALGFIMYFLLLQATVLVPTFLIGFIVRTVVGSRS